MRVESFAVLQHAPHQRLGKLTHRQVIHGGRRQFFFLAPVGFALKHIHHRRALVQPEMLQLRL